jgi:hypothetical protein
MSFRQIIDGNTLGKNFPLPDKISTFPLPPLPDDVARNQDILTPMFLGIFPSGFSRGWSSTDGVTWENNAMPFSSQWSAITYGNGKFVALQNYSSDGYYSVDGVTWVRITMPSSAQWSAITYGNDKFVAFAGSSGAAAYSSDGVTWTLFNLNDSSYWASVTYGNGKFVALSQDTFATSDNGIAWTVYSAPPDEVWRDVTYGNGKFVAVAFGAVTTAAAYSVNGIDWELSESSIVDCFHVTFGGGMFFAKSTSGNSYSYSLDGVSWGDSALPSSVPSKNWRGQAYGNGMFVIHGYSGASIESLVASSTDGFTWTISELDSNINIDALTYGYAKIGETLNSRINKITTKF